MAKFKMGPLIGTDAFTTRLGAGTGAANYVDDKEIGKLVKQAADSRYDLAAAGDPIEGYIAAVETYTADDYSIGSVVANGRMRVTLDGLQATPGTGTIDINDYVVTGTVVAKGTSLAGAYPKVCKATNQPGATVTTADATKPNIDIALAAVTSQCKNGIFAWRVVALDGTTAVGQTAVVERVSI